MKDVDEMTLRLVRPEVLDEMRAQDEKRGMTKLRIVSGLDGCYNRTMLLTLPS